MGLAKEDVDVLVNKIVTNRRGTVAQRWRVTQTLILDEISMVDGRFFDKVRRLPYSLTGVLTRFCSLRLSLVPFEIIPNHLEACRCAPYLRSHSHVPTLLLVGDMWRLLPTTASARHHAEGEGKRHLDVRF